MVFTMRQRLLLLAIGSSYTACNGLVSPAIGTRSSKAQARTTSTATFLFKRNKELREDHHPIDSPSSASAAARTTRRGRVFSALRKQKGVQMQTLDTNEDIESSWILSTLESSSPESHSLLDIIGATTTENVVDPSIVKSPPPTSQPTQAAVPSLRMGSNGTMALDPAGLVSKRRSSPKEVTPPDGSVGGPLMTRFSRQWFQNIVTGLIFRWSKEDPVNLQVKASPQGNVLGNLMMRGQYRSNVELTFDKVHFGNIMISGGGRLDAHRLALNVWSFAPQLLRMGTYRFPRQFEFHAHDCTLTQDDLLGSSCIRNGLGRLLRRILRRVGVTTADVTITSVNVLRNNMISCSGEATTNFGSRMNFEVQTGIRPSCRGHVLEFPGLQVSLQPELGLFVPVVPEINLDVGHNAQLTKLKINGKTKCVSLDATVSITPQHTTLNLPTRHYIQSHEAFLAQFSFDVGRWLTNIGNFTN